MDEIVILYTTSPDQKNAEAIAAGLVAKHLVACVNILPPIQSIYLWRGELENTEEVPMLIKTTTKMSGKAREYILRKHPYEVPALVAIPILAAASSSEFLAWINSQVKAE